MRTPHVHTKRIYLSEIDVKKIKSIVSSNRSDDKYYYIDRGKEEERLLCLIFIYFFFFLVKIDVYIYKRDAMSTRDI